MYTYTIYTCSYIYYIPYTPDNPYIIHIIHIYIYCLIYWDAHPGHPGHPQRLACGTHGHIATQRQAVPVCHHDLRDFCRWSKGKLGLPISMGSGQRVIQWGFNQRKWIEWSSVSSGSHGPWTVRWMTVFENSDIPLRKLLDCQRVVSGLPHPHISRTSHHLVSIDFPGDVRAKNLWISRLSPLPNSRPISFHEFSRRDQPSILPREVQMVHVNYPVGFHGVVSIDLKYTL